jgi:hypothetical protein
MNSVLYHLQCYTSIIQQFLLSKTHMQLKNFHLFGPLPASVSLGIFGTLACCWFITPQMFAVRVPNILPLLFQSGSCK